MRFTLVPAICLPLVLAGCATTPTFAPSTPSAIRGAAISGVVHGGQQPIVGAEIFLFAANTTGYGGNGLAAGTSNASISLLQPAANTVQDTASTNPTYLDYYTTTASDGSFSITGDYSCIPGQQVYIYALGGNPTYPNGSANSAIGLLAALGACPSADIFPSNTYVVVNEVSTVAAAYAFAGFATDALHVSSSGTALAQTGIANAFANAANLETLSTGAALATTPAGNGKVPQATINTLADILAACVNTSSPSSSGCSTLFANARSAGSTGTTATDTATAAINIAHNPGSNIAALYGLTTANPPFTSALALQPNDFTLGLSFTGGGLSLPYSIAIDSSGNAWTVQGAVSKFSSTGAALSPSTGFTGGGLSESNFITIDGSGNAWITNYDTSSVSKFSNAGVALSPSFSGYTGGGLAYPFAVAIDGLGNAWIANNGANGGSSQSSVSKFSSAGVALSPSSGYTGGGLSGPDSIAIDGSGNAWITNNFFTGSVSKLSNAGVALSPSTGYTAGGVTSPYSVAIDSAGNAWIANYSGGVGFGALSELSNTGIALSPSTGFTGGGVYNPVSVAIDGAGNVWLANKSISGSVSEFSSAGVALSPSNGYIADGLYYPHSIAIDPSGNVWTANYLSSPSHPTISEFIGAAAPVITPISAGLPATPTSDGSSKLGTRP